MSLILLPAAVSTVILHFQWFLNVHTFSFLAGDLLLKASVSILPVFIFLVTLMVLDSFKLIKIRSILLTLLCGSFTAGVSFVINSSVLELTTIPFSEYSRYCAPFVEELLKGLYIILLVRKKRIGFLIDAAIYGFSIGAGFAFIENMYYVHSVTNSHLFVWIIRGFGTAIMHGGTTTIFALLAMNLSGKRSSNKEFIFLPGLAAAILIHGFFNFFLFSPLIMTICQLVLLPVVIIFVFSKSEQSLREWLEIGLDTDVYVLDMIMSGNIAESKIGQYLDSLQQKFPGEIVVDMLCLLRNHLELTIRAKGVLMMREAGFKVPHDPEVRKRFDELQYLEKSIGKTGKLAILPFLHTSSLDLWQLFVLRDN